jgi:hypothetical protein
MNTPIAPLALDDQQVAAALGLTVTPHQIAKLRARGQFPPAGIVIGNRKLVLVADLNTWIAEQREKAEVATAYRSAVARNAGNTRWHKE